MFRKSILATTLAAATLLAGQSAFAAAYSGTGAGSSTVGSGGDYATINAACLAINAVGTRDATAWTFEITGDISETANSFINCTVDPAGSITFRPAAGVKAQVNWPLIADNAGTSGRIVIGANLVNTTGMFKTDNIIFDGSNTIGGKTRDLAFVGVASETTSGHFINVLGNSDGIQVRNMVITSFSTAGTASCVGFRNHNNAVEANKCPDNWVVDNCYLQSLGSTSGAGVRVDSSQAPPAGQGASGWTISNNTIAAGVRAIYLNPAGSGTVNNNTIRVVGGNGIIGAAIYQLGTNASTGATWDITNNVIDYIQNPNVTAVEFGAQGIILSPGAGANNTYNVKNNIIAGWAFTGATPVDSAYRGISIGTAPNTTVVNIENNSINMNSTTLVTGATLGRTHAIARTAGNATLNIKNNLIRYLQGGTNSYAIYTSAAGDISLAGNSIVIGGSSAGFASIGGVTQTNFAGYQTLDADAQNVDPTTTTGGAWASATANQIADLHFTGAPVELVNTATAASVLTDVDGDVRASLAIPGADVYTAGGSYAWDGSANTEMSEPDNWTPARNNPRWNDVLNVSTGGAQTIVLRDQHISGLHVSNNTDLTLRPFPTAVAGATGAGGIQTRISIFNAGAGNELTVAAGSTLRVTGTGSVRVDLLGGSTGVVSGDVILANGFASAVQQIISRTANGLAFNSGSTMAMAPGFSGGGSPFGSSATLDGANGNAADSTGVVFNSGSTYYNGGLKDGTISAAAPSNPFAGTAPLSALEFKPGSEFVLLGSGTPSVSGRTFGYGGHVVLRNSATVTVTGANAWTIGGNLLSAVPPTTAGPFNIGLTGGSATVLTIGGHLIVLPLSGGIGDTGVPASANAVVDIKGNVDIQDASLFAPSTNANRVYQLSGTSSQDIDFAGDTLINLTLNNAAGAVMSGDLGINGALVLAAGNLNTNGNLLTLGPAATISGAGQLITNEIARIVDSSVLGVSTLPLPNNPVSFEVTVAGTGTGTVLASTTATPGASLPGGVFGINRSWILTDAGITGYTATLVFNYSDAELGSAVENNLVAARFNGATWEIYSGTSTRDTILNTVTVTGVTALSPWTLVDASSSVSDWSILHND